MYLNVVADRPQEDFQPIPFGYVFALGYSALCDEFGQQ